ncbi:MAG: TetR/AcrR family transcriptional regulator [Deltaproteobacteria bacterium]|nr:TetR/AcrR family transcriptional regulator [Deltaproteobacteria bacterium]
MKQNPSNMREEIIKAATDLFYEKGFEKASLRDIAHKVGLTQAAIYYHFRNKEEILYTIIETSSNELFFTLKSCFSGNEDPLEQLKNAIFQHILLIKTNRKGAKIIIEDKRFLSGELNRLVKEKERTIYNLYKNQLDQLQRTMKVKDCDLTLATFAILGMINWLYHWYRSDKNLAIERLADSLINIYLNGILYRSGGSGE